MAFVVALSLLSCKVAPPPVAVEPTFVTVKVAASQGAQKPLLVLLHGFGSNERDLVPLATALTERFEVWSLRAPVSLGEERYAWFNLQFGPGGARTSDPKQIADARRQLAAWLRARAPRPVFLLGFSQGAMMALSIAAAEPTLVRGAVAVSGRLPAETPVVSGSQPPVLILQGTRDGVIAPENAELAASALRTGGRVVELRTFDAAHEITPEMRAALESWLASQ